MHIIEYILVLFAKNCLSLLPHTVVRILARWTGFVLFRILRFRHHGTMSNVRNALPDLTPDEHRRIATESFQSVAITLFEFLRFGSMDEARLRSLAVITNPEVLQDALSEGKGLLLLTAHIGSWEIFGQVAGLATKREGRLLMKVQSNLLVAREIDRLRTRFGLKTAPSSGGLRDIVRTLSSGGWVVIAADQAAPQESLPVVFFGRPVPTYQGPASFALQTGAVMLLGAAIRQANDSYRITFRRIDHADLDRTDENALRILTERHVQATEALIRGVPGQWMWMHRRWKHVDKP